MFRAEIFAILNSGENAKRNLNEQSMQGTSAQADYRVTDTGNRNPKKLQLLPPPPPEQNLFYVAQFIPERIGDGRQGRVFGQVALFHQSCWWRGWRGVDTQSERGLASTSILSASWAEKFHECTQESGLVYTICSLWFILCSLNATKYTKMPFLLST